MEFKGYTGPKQSGFIFGGDTGVSHKQLQTKRRIAEAMAANMAGRTPQNVGEGLTAIGDALRYRKLMNSIDKGEAQLGQREAQGRSKAKELIAAALQGREPKPYASSTGPMTMFGVQPPARSPEQEIGDDTMAALGKDNAMSIEGQVLKGLTDRGLPEHVAQGFLMNFRDESGLNPGINEISPIVPGSRGGFGLAQWTGPRRKQLEAFAQAQGKPVSDMDLQLDFLMSELQGSESAAGRTILSARNAPEAATAIVNDFLRPAEEHRARRVAQYGGAAPEPQQPDYSAIYEALSSPWLDQGQRAMLMSELEDRKAAYGRSYDQWQQQNDPMRQLQLQKAQLELERMQNPQPGFSVLTDEQEAQMGLDPAGSYQRGADGKISQIGGSKSNVNVSVGLGANGEQTEYSQPVTPAQKKVDEEFAKTYVPWSQGGGADMASQIAQIETVADQLENGNANLTGPILGSLPDVIGAATNPSAVAARETVENVVQRNLRLLLGAQFTAKEGEQLIARAYNARLPEAENAKRLRRLSLAMKAAAQDTQSQVDYYQQNGTLTGWEGRQWTIADFEAAIEGSGQSDVTQATTEAQQPSTGAPQVGTIEDGYRFLGGDPQNPENWEQVN